VGSESWVQVGSLITVNGANAKVIYLGKTHAGKFYLITLVDAAQNFDKTNQQFFQPALKTFKWA
jgi:hypothetical protein